MIQVVTQYWYHVNIHLFICSDKQNIAQIYVISFTRPYGIEYAVVKLPIIGPSPDLILSYSLFAKR